jgi:pSer/pThr/pTyr-binding forkhead associated (FHA) protein
VSHCLQCGIEIALGGLCVPHAEAVATCPDMTAEQIVSKPVELPSACLIDQWGNTHTLGERSLIGRVASECTVTVLHHSVSAIHAQIDRSRQVPGGSVWRLMDRGSLNGTYLEGEPVRQSTLQDGDRIRFGDVSFYFSSDVELPRQLARHPGGHTVPTRQRDIIFQARVTDESGREIGLVQRATGGIVRIDEETALEFARLEFGLLKILAERRLGHPDAELAFVSSQELAELLDFKSQEADGENVRELVRRVRRKFKVQGVDDLIESRQGVGYRLTWQVRNG